MILWSVFNYTKSVAGTTYDSGAVISPGGINKSMVIIHFNNLGSVNSSRKFIKLTFRLMNFHSYNISA